MSSRIWRSASNRTWPPNCRNLICVRSWRIWPNSEPATARLRLTAVKLFARWLAAEEGFDADPVLAVRAPRLDDKAVADLSLDEVQRIAKRCKGSTFRDKRDYAMLLLLTETGLFKRAHRDCSAWTSPT